MITSKDAGLVYETLLMSPGMTDAVKIPLSAKRKTLLMLAKIIEQGISQKEEMKEPCLLSVMDQQTTEELKTLAESLLERGGLAELNARLATLNLK